MTSFELSRRKFFGLLATPAVLRVTKPMALWSPAKPIILIGDLTTETGDFTYYPMLTLEQMSREALRLFKDSNRFLQNIDKQYVNIFAKAETKIGPKLLIRLPNNS